MAHFSPAVMARLASIDIDASAPFDSSFEGMKRCYRFQGTWSQWLDLTRQAQNEPSRAQRAFQLALADKFPSQWTGVTDTLPKFQATGTYSDALVEFQKTRAKLEPSHFQAATPAPAMVGTWIVPLVLAGNPMAARLRPRTKLPPVNLEVSLSVVNTVPWQVITASIATLARAVWNYIQAGGAATLTVHYAAGFHEPQDGHDGFIASISIPTTNIAAFASAASAQEFRAMFLAFGLRLSGLSRDTGVVLHWKKPGLLYLSGDPASDAKVLQTLKIS